MSIYKTYDIDQLADHFRNYLVDSWSYSKITSFARNEKAFEMNYIYGLYAKNSATQVAGQAYHKALEYYFTQKKQGKTLDLVELEASAFQHINEMDANYWKLQKTTPTVEECMNKASSTSADLLRNFYKEKGTYEDDLQEIIDVEVKCEEFISVNGVDIPLPCHGKIDLVIKTRDGKNVIVDHKSKNVYTDEAEISLSIGTQAITYKLLYEEKTGIEIDEVWFVENKYSKNKSGEPQLRCFKVTLDENTCRLYEALLYEPLKRMVEAVSDPDYVYMINESDNYIDKAEVYDFWARTMISEVEDFNVDETKKELVSQRLRRVRDASLTSINPSVIKIFKDNASKFIQYDLSNKNMTKAEKIEHVLRSFGTIVRVAHMFDGYSSNTYLLEISAGVKISSVHSRRLDIANALDVSSVRMSKDLVVYEDRSYVAVEFSKKRDKTLFFDPAEFKDMRIPIGKDNFGNTIVWDLNNQNTPHALICGSTGSGKSVCIRSIIEYAKLGDVDDIIILDPKREFTSYGYEGDGRIEVVQDILEIEDRMKRLVDYMNELVKRNKVKRTLIIFDEFADALANSRQGNELKVYENRLDGFYANGNEKRKRVHVSDLASLEENLRILLQKGRSSGFRIVAATQRASVKVITGDAKVNFPVQICFRVPKAQDSRVVLDEEGAESLAGGGDGLIKSPEYKDVTRFQAFYFDPSKVEA